MIDGPTDVFAEIYERLVAGANRRRLGTFFTPVSVVALMLDRAAEYVRAPTQVVDPGAGVGAFTLAAARRWPGAAVSAVDVNVVTLGLLGARLALEEEALGVRLVLDDYMTWLGGAASRRASGPTLLIGNPPYTRHQELDEKTKATGMAASGGLVESGLAGLAAYFLASSLNYLRPDDGLCFVLPGSWTEARYGRRLRNWVWRHERRPVEMIAFPPTLDVFPGTRVTAMVLLVGPEAKTSMPLNIRSVATKRQQLVVRGPKMTPRRGEAPNTFGPILWPTPSGAGSRKAAVSDIARVRRGVATGANHFFFLTDENANDLPSSLVRPALRRLRHVSGDVLDIQEHDELGRAGHPRWLLSLRGPGDAAHTRVAELLKSGVTAGYSTRHLTSIREYWYVVENVEPPDIIVSLMSKDGFRAVRNLVRAIPSNSMYGLYLHDQRQIDALCAWLNSPRGQAAIRERARHYSNGLFKLEPRDYLTVNIPASLLPE